MTVAICSEVLRKQGKPYPRTCAVHGLGPCNPEQRKYRYTVSIVCSDGANLSATVRTAEDHERVKQALEKAFQETGGE